MKNDSEKQSSIPEGNQEALHTGIDYQSDQPRASYEDVGEQMPDNIESATEARAEALESAISAETVELSKPPEAKPETHNKSGSVSKKDRELSYSRTMQEVQGHMSAPSRAFSKVIHNRAIEAGSEVIGKTLARPNAILAGSLTAFILSFAVYMIAKTLGYPLSGFETIAAFILGWVIGILFDYFKVLITGKK